MSDMFGLLEFPARAPAAGEALTDPALDMVLAFMKAVLNADLGAAWASRAAADPLPVAHVFNHNPDLESFNTNDTPAIYAWRGDDKTGGRYSQDLVSDESSFNCLWVPPPADQESARYREAIRNGIKKSLKAAFAQGRHPAWVLPGDDYYQPDDYGSVLLRHAKLAKATLGPFRTHTLVIESQDKRFKQPFDCLFFTVETLEFLSIDAAAKFGAFDHVRGTTSLAARAYNEPSAVDTLGLVADGETLTFNYQLGIVSLTPDTGDVAGGTEITVTGSQYPEDELMVDFIGVAASNSEATRDGATSLLGTSATSAIGQSFEGNGEALSSARFYLKKTGSPTGNAVAKIYRHAGTYGTSSVPTGQPLARSTPLDVSTLTTSYAVTDFAFEGEARITLESGTEYVLVLEYLDGSAGNTVDVGKDDSSPGADGNASAYVAAAWSASAGSDYCFYVLSFVTVDVDVDDHLDESTFTVETPAHAAGVTSVRVRAPSGDEATLADAFTFA